MAPSIVSAQYLDVSGNVVATTSQSVAVVGGTVTLTCQVNDSAGNGVGSAPCSFTIIGAPDGDASLGPATITTDSNGNGTTQLFVGNTPGAVVIEVGSDPVTSRVTILVTPSGETTSRVPASQESPLLAAVA